MSDEVKAALAAATEAAMESIGWPDDGSMDFEPRDTCRDAAAAAVAAFLRTLPNSQMFQGHGHDPLPLGPLRPCGLHDIAAAVEQAARDV